MTLAYTANAEEHLLDAVRWYDQQSPHLGERFHAAVREREALLKLFPQHGERHEGTIRRVKVRSFPYFLLYDTRPGMIVVVAVVHGARGPRAWKQR
jgi:plasmid stabilization system protein ParE